MRHPEKWIIYCLKDPRIGEVRYVGWTSQTAQKRLGCHISEARHERRQSHTFKVRWVRSLLEAGIRPVMEILETGSGPNWSAAERRWIAIFREKGVSLTNGSDGGEGNLGYNPPPEVRARLSQASKGRKLSPEHRAKFIEAARKENTGKVHTAESVEKRASKLRGIPRSPEVMANCRAKVKGRVASAENREKIAAARRGSKASEETRRKMSASRKGRTHSAETCAKLSAIFKGRRTCPPEIHAAAAAKRRGKPNPAVWKMIQSNIGRKRSPEAIAKTTAANLQWGPEIKEKLSAQAKTRTRNALGHFIKETA